MGVAAAGTAKQLEMLGVNTGKFVAIAGAAGVASVGLAGALGVGLGGAFAGVGVAAALMNKTTRKEFKDLGQGIKNQLAADAAPVAATMSNLVKYINTSLKTMRPVLQGLFKDIAPLVDIFGKGLVGAVANVVTEFQPLIKVVTPLVRTLFAQLPDLIGNIAGALQTILAPANGLTRAFGTLLGGVGQLLGPVSKIIGSLVKLGAQILPVLVPVLVSVGNALSGGLGKLLPIVGAAIDKMLPPLGKLASALAGGLGTVLAAVVPVLGRIVPLLANALAPVIGPLAQGFADLVGSVGKMLPALLPLAGPLVLIVKGVGNLIGPLASVAGTMATALTPALKVIGPMLGTVAGTVGKALADAFQKAAPSLASLAQSVGDMLIALVPLVPVVVAAALAFAPMVPTIAKLAAGFAQGLLPVVQTLVPLLIPLAPTITKIWIASKLWAVAQGLLNVALAANPLGLVILAVAGLAAGLVYAWKHSETFRDIVKGAFNAVKVAVGAVITFIIQNFKFWFDTATTVVLGILNLFGKLPGPMGKPFRAAEDAVRKAKGTVDTQLDKIQKRVNQLTGKDIPITARTDVQIAKSVRQYLAAANVPGFHAKGTLVPGYGGGDVYPAYLEPGEAVVPKDKARRPDFRAWAAMMGIPGFQMGGLVTSFYQPTIRQTGRIGQSMADVAAAVLSMAGSIPGGTASVDKVAKWTAAVLGRAGEWMAWARRIMFESGGNWSAVNRTDSNWLAGHPSVGGAQVIRGTFAANAGRFRNVGPFLYGVSINPYANSYAGGHYAIGRYGSLAAVDPLTRPIGYDRGGFIPHGGLALNTTGRPEALGFNYDKMADAFVRALQRYGLTVAVDDIHQGLLAKKNRQGGVPLRLT